MSIELAQDQAARSLLLDEGFVEAWRRLAEQCPWSTVFQEPDYVRGWLTAEAEPWSPWVAYEHGLDGALEGLALLARNPEGRLMPMGGPEAWLHGPLARPLRGSFFIEQVVQQLSHTENRGTLVFDLWTPGAPLDWMLPQRGLGANARRESETTFWLSVDPSCARIKLEKKVNSQQLSRIKAHGRISLKDDASDPGLFEALTSWPVRPGVGPFEGTAALSGAAFRSVWSKLLSAGRLKTSVLCVNDETWAVMVGFVRDRILRVLWWVENPRHEGLAPSMLHWPLLEDGLRLEGVDKVDVTRGPSWALASAERDRSAQRVLVFFDRPSRLRYDASHGFVELSRRALRLWDG